MWTGFFLSHLAPVDKELPFLDHKWLQRQWRLQMVRSQIWLQTTGSADWMIIKPYWCEPVDLRLDFCWVSFTCTSLLQARRARVDHHPLGAPFVIFIVPASLFYPGTQVLKCVPAAEMSVNQFSKTYQTEPRRDKIKLLKAQSGELP